MDVAKLKVFVFDFDGTLVDSNNLKRESFFKILPDDSAFNKKMDDVLNELPEASRYIVIEKALRELGRDHLESDVEKLALRYGELAQQAAIDCPEIDGAIELLESLNRLGIPTYLSSNTALKNLKEIIERRCWNQYFKGLYGYPYQKDATLKEILEIHKIKSDEALVIGDGNSDEQSAKVNNTHFYDVRVKTIRALLDEVASV